VIITALSTTDTPAQMPVFAPTAAITNALIFIDGYGIHTAIKINLYNSNIYFIVQCSIV
jgi:hypothetical protein